MFDKRTLRALIGPAVMLLVVSLLAFWAGTGFQTEANIFTMALLSSLFTEVLAFFSCWVLVIRPEREYHYIWINYAVWAIIMNIGYVMSWLSL